MSSGMLQRRKVPADNNCLFTAFSFLCEGTSSEIQLSVAARKLRRVCADTVLADPDPLLRAALLGFDSVDAYGEWIQNTHHWGGEPEVLMLAQVSACPAHRARHTRAPPQAPLFLRSILMSRCPSSRARRCAFYGTRPSQEARAPCTFCTRGSTTTRSWAQHRPTAPRRRGSFPSPTPPQQLRARRRRSSWPSSTQGKQKVRLANQGE